MTSGGSVSNPRWIIRFLEIKGAENRKAVFPKVLRVQVSQDIEFLGHFENREPRPRKMRVYTRRGKRCIVSDLFYSEVGRLDQFTKYPVEHEGPVIISMI